MSQAISFAWTTPALLVGAKTVTRRDWSGDYARRFRASGLEMHHITALDKDRRYGGKLVAIIRLTEAPYRQADRRAPDSDYEAEGFDWLRQHPQFMPKSERALARVTLSREGFDAWRNGGGESWVVRFELVKVIDQERLKQIMEAI